MQNLEQSLELLERRTEKLLVKLESSDVGSLLEDETFVEGLEEFLNWIIILRERGYVIQHSDISSLPIFHSLFMLIEELINDNNSEILEPISNDLKDLASKAEAISTLFISPPPPASQSDIVPKITRK